MAFAQIHYSQRLGSGPTAGTIAEYGCFLTSFCNLLARFGENIDPPTLNNYFLQHGSYTADPEGDVDLLSWGSVSVYDSQLVTVGTGFGWPDSNDAIVKFVYRNSRGGTVTHFCLVADHSAHTIVDSWDGVVKQSPYGQPVAWAKYERHAPQKVVIVPPATPPAAPPFIIENIPETTKELKITTHLWDLNRRSWPDMANNPVGTGNEGTTFKTNRIAHHILGGAYYLPDGSADQGYNVVDCEEPIASPAPTPAPVSKPVPVTPKFYTENMLEGIKFTAVDGQPKHMWVSKVGGTEKWNFKNVKNWRDFKSVQHLDYGAEVFISGIAHHPIPPNGATYYMTGDDFGDFKKTGKPANFYGFNRVDLSDTKPPKLPEPAVMSVTQPAAQVIVTRDTASAPIDWQSTYRPFPKPVRYIATRNMTVKDLSGKQPDMPLPEYNPDTYPEQGVVQAYGRVNYQGIDYYRLKTNNDPTFSFWYCVPVIDAVTHAANLLVYPTDQSYSKTENARDLIKLGTAKLETGAIQFLDDILPKWLRNKK